VGAASVVVVVGPQQPVPSGVELTQEDPPGGGPVAAIAAGLDRVSAELVVILAVDYPLVDSAVIADLIASLGDADGCVLRDDGGRDQPLAGVFRIARLRAALDRLPSAAGTSVRGVMQMLHVKSITRMPAALDCDTPEDLERLNELAGDGSP
jgi:molybdopterin-guanine dinucleotide biosynthesis protein A